MPQELQKPNEDVARDDTLALDFHDKDVDEFWSSVKQLNRSRSLLSNCIEGEKTFLTTGKNIFIRSLIVTAMQLIYNIMS